jgi:hypothetical protein
VWFISSSDLLGLLARSARSAKGGAVGVGGRGGETAFCIRVKAELGVSGVGVVFRLLTFIFCTFLHGRG